MEFWGECDVTHDATVSFVQGLLQQFDEAAANTVLPNFVVVRVSRRRECCEEAMVQVHGLLLPFFLVFVSSVSVQWCFVCSGPTLYCQPQ